MKGWLFGPIRALLGTPDFAFAAVNLALSYFEGWAQYRFGDDSRRQSREFFVRAMHDVFPFSACEVDERAGEITEIFGILYDEARCGALHVPPDFSPPAGSLKGP